MVRIHLYPPMLKVILDNLLIILYNSFLNHSKANIWENNMAAVNYTPDQVEQMVEMYTNGDPVVDIADVVGKSTRSVIAKLSREGVYIAQPRKVATGAVRKAQIVATIASHVGADVESLTKASKDDLVILATAIQSWAK